MSIDSPFKAYDVRGRIGENLTEDMVRRIGRAFAEVIQPGSVVVGHDSRETSPLFANALAEGLIAGGVDVQELGLCGTEEIYFATDHRKTGGGLMVTASHNPIEYNGIKMVLAGARPMSRETGLDEIEDLSLNTDLADVATPGTRQVINVRDAYVDKVLSFVDPKALGDLKLVVNAGNGSAGPTFDAIADALAKRGAGVTFHRQHHNPDPAFPNGIPNPLLPENHAATSDAVLAAGADFGVAWDGDFDRCFFFDGQGSFIDGAYVVGVLAAAFLAKYPGQVVVHDPRVVLNTQDLVNSAGGTAIAACTGHTFMKQAMRDHNGIYGGEMSAHHYFRDFMFCDSGMIPWLLVAELVATSGKSLADLVADRMAKFPVSGEINFRIADADKAMADVLAAYEADAVARDNMDGISLLFETWRFNLRRSNTESLVRLNVESKGDAALVAAKHADIAAILTKAG